MPEYIQITDPIPHPIRCDYHPKFETKHHAACFIEIYQAEGHMKKCAHLSVHEFGDGFASLYYGPRCDEHSFDRRDAGYRSSLFYGCPPDCRMFEDATRAKTKIFVKRQWRHFRDSIVGISRWFASLPMLTQVVLLLILLTLVGIPWRGTVWQIIKLLASTK